MDLRSLILCLSSFTLGITGYTVGILFIRRYANVLLGLELIIVGTSSFNGVYYFATGSKISFLLVEFLDTFSRAFGIPFLAPLGIMAITRNFKPSLQFDIFAFAACTVATLVLLLVPAFRGPLPYLMLAIWTAYSFYILTFAYKLHQAGKNGYAFLTVLTTLFSQGIATICDFYKIPGEDTNIFFNYFTLALLTWTFAAIVMYFSYGALDHAYKTRVRQAASPA